MSLLFQHCYSLLYLVRCIEQTDGRGEGGGQTGAASYKQKEIIKLQRPCEEITQLFGFSLLWRQRPKLPHQSNLQ